MIREALLQEILTLSVDERRKLVEVITESLDETPKSDLTERIPGLNAHPDFWMSDDFDAPLFADAWMDDPNDPLSWKIRTEDQEK